MTSSYVNGTTTTYAYRGDGLRKSKSTNGVTTNHVWDGDQIVQDLDGYDVSREYVRGLRLIDTYAVGDTARIAYIQNARGDVVGHVNTLTTAIDFVDYDAYGNFESSAPSDPLAYCGEYLDSETGFIYLRARYYDPTTGRFTSVDPARDGLNWYVYCNNNPVNFVDPTGLKPGDYFETEEDAAKDFADIYNPISIEEDAEYGAYIYKIHAVIEIDGKAVISTFYSYAEPVKGKTRTVSIELFNQIKHGGTITAIAHTHGRYRSFIDVENFSPEDIAIAKSKEVKKIYVATPGGFLYECDTEDAEKVFVAYVPYDYKSPDTPWWRKLNPRGGIRYEDEEDFDIASILYH